MNFALELKRGTLKIAPMGTFRLCQTINNCVIIDYIVMNFANVMIYGGRQF
ncbi:hypothetical protein [Clostridium pasteurianum]|uniref:hypothetical protein n=1 Tax=Clostridium pasteurianum TaxID=1501 RepID=UPI001A9A3F4E|nr:hypothetical protein [Clostridium pasteurianum]